MTEYEAVRTFIFEKLATPCRPAVVYEDVIPEGAPLPAVVFQAFSADDLNTQDTRTETTFPVIVKAEAAGDDRGQTLTLAAAIDGALQGARATYTGKEVFALRDQAIPGGPIEEDGKRYVQDGGRYFVIVRPA